MFSPRESEAVLEELGDKFPLALVRATDAAREDLSDLRSWRPDWIVAMFQREVAGILHSRIWAHLMSELEDVEGITFHTQEPFREICTTTPMGRTFKMRVKRHSEDDRISSYSTASDLEIWGGAVVTFSGMEQITLAAGYRWISETGEVGAPVISYREGKDNVIWAVEVDAGIAGSATSLHYTPILPPLPGVELAAADRDEEYEAE